MEWSEYVLSLREKNQKRGIPFSAAFELTPFCNFGCNMCYIRLSPEQAKAQGSLLSTNQWIDIAEQSRKAGVLGIEITGGEAITRADFPILYEEFIKMGYIIALRSNGYLIRGKLLSLLKKYKPRCVSITLYGASDETYQKVCGISDGFSVVTQNIYDLRGAGIVPRLTVTLTNDNINDKPYIKEWAKNNGFNIAFYGGLITPIRSAKRSIDQLRIDYNRNYNCSGIDVKDRNIQNRDEYLNPFWMCSSYGTKFCISWDGRMTLCNSFPYIWSDAISQSIMEAYKSLYEQLSMLKRPQKCNNCQVIDFCTSCPARFLSETGNPAETNTRICSIAERRYQVSKLYSKSCEDHE